NANNNSEWAGTGPGRRAEDPESTGGFRRRAGDRKSRAGERTPRSQTRTGGDGAAAKRRPDWRSSGYGVGAHLNRAVPGRWSEATSRPAATAGRQLPWRGRGWHRPRYALRVPGQRHEATFRHRLRWRVGRLYRRLRDEDSQPHGSAVLQLRRVARDSQPVGEGLDRQAPDHGRRLVRRQSESDSGGDATA